MDAESIEERFLELRKALKRFPKDATADEVHKLRTSSRRLEAVVSALGVGPGKDRRRLVEAVKPIRKVAGDVRDMDVLSAKVLGLVAKKTAGTNGNDALVRLSEHLGEMRMEGARDLFDTVSKHRASARRNLKQQARRIVAKLDKDGAAGRLATRAIARGLELVEKLGRWPKLDAENLHGFRIKVKELRYVLQMSGERTELVKRLGEVKDRIGEWHDWQELERIAGEVLGGKDDRGELARIRVIERKMFEQALGSANGLRRSYLDGETKKKGPGSVSAAPVGKAAGLLAG